MKTNIIYQYQSSPKVYFILVLIIVLIIAIVFVASKFPEIGQRYGIKWNGGRTEGIYNPDSLIKIFRIVGVIGVVMCILGIVVNAKSDLAYKNAEQNQLIETVEGTIEEISYNESEEYIKIDGATYILSADSYYDNVSEMASWKELRLKYYLNEEEKIVTYVEVLE